MERSRRINMPKPTNGDCTAWYALRRTLPPWRFEESLAELTDFCPRARIDEVIVKCDTEEFSHGYPSLEWLRAYQPLLRRTRAALARIGVVYSLNPWVTQGHIDRGRDLRDRFPGMRMMVGHDGVSAKAQACPLCPVWREHTRALWILYAETQPRAIWIEDDIRTFNHRPVQYGCFCAEHLRRFSERAGERVVREALVDALLAPGAPHPWRVLWLDLQAEAMIDTVRFLERSVHAVSPGSALGLMSSGPDNHCLEGRRWEEFGRALAGPTPLYSRPPLGNYSEDSLRGLWYTARSIKQTRHALRVSAIEQTEVENWPFTLYSKSAAFTAVQMAVSFAFGAHGVTLNLYDHMGTPLAENPAFEKTLAQWKPFLNALRRRCGMPAGQPAAPCAGIRLLHHERAGYTKHLPEQAGFSCLTQTAHGWHDPLEALGFPTTYDPAPVAALTGQTARALPPAEIERLLAGGVLLDASAAQTLEQLGWGADLGAKVAKLAAKDDFPLAAEEWIQPDFGGAPRHYMTMTLPDLAGGMTLALLERDPRAVAVSRAVDPDGKEIMPWLTVFENARGGRVAVLPLVLEPGRFLSLLNPMRKRQLSRIIHWLARGRLPLEVTADAGVYPLGFRRDFADRAVLGAFNLSLDPWAGVAFDLHADRRIAGLQVLSASGRWKTLPADCAVSTGAERFRIVWPHSVTYATPVVMEISWECG
jgi:hypothetical protein